MPVLQHNPALWKTAAGGGDTAAYQIERSLRFDSVDQANLELLPGDGNKRRFTISVWCKHTKLGDETNLLGNYNPTSGNWEGMNLYINSGDNVEFHHYTGSTYNIRRRTTAKLTDISAWYHIVVAVDTTDAVDKERCKVYINGERIFDFESSVLNHPTQDYNMEMGTFSQPFNVGYQYGYSDGYVADLYFIDGLVLSPAAFGSFDSNTGIWNPKAYALPAPNDGTTWSSGVSGSIYSGDAATEAFDGSTSSSIEGADNSILTWTAAGDGITVNSQVEVYIRIKGDINGESIFKVNDVSYHEEARTNNGDNTFGWYALPSNIRTLSKIEWGREGSSNFVVLGAVRVDGSILVDGRTDFTTGNNPHNGTIWSSYTTTNNGFGANTPASKGFNGDLSSANHLQGDHTANSRVTFDVPGDGLPFHTLRIYGGKDNALTDSNSFTVNGTDITSQISAGTNWHTITGVSSPLTEVTALAKQSGQVCYWHAIELDGVILRDGWADNSLHLKFNDTTTDTTLGYSSLPADVNDPNRGGPILKTTATSSGRTLDTGTNTDANASSLVLAIPGNSATDVHHTVKGSGSAKTITYTGTCSAKTAISRYYGTSTYVESGGYIKVSQTNDCLFSGQLTIEGWFYLDSGTNNQVLVWSDGTGTGRYLIWTDSSKLTLVVYSGNTPTQRVQGSTVLKTKRWYHMAMCRDSSDVVTMYLNGISQGTWDSSSMSESLGGQSNDTAPEIGSQDGGNAMTGYLQDWRFYTTCKYSGNFDPQAPKDFTVNNIIAAASGKKYTSGSDLTSSLWDGSTSTNAGLTTQSYKEMTDQSITVNTSFEVFTNDESGQINTIKDGNGNEYQCTDDIGGSNWRVLYNANSQSGTNYTGTLAGPIQVKVSYGSSYIYAVRVDGTILTDQPLDETDSFTDSPTNYVGDDGDTGAGGEVRGNYCTLNPLSLAMSGGGLTVKQGNLFVSRSGGGNRFLDTTWTISSGKWYYEATVGSSISSYPRIGIWNRVGTENRSNYPGESAAGYNRGWGATGISYNGSGDSAGGLPTFGANDTLMFALDMDNGKIWFGKNGTWYTTGTTTTTAGAIANNTATAKFSDLLTESTGTSWTPICHQNPDDSWSWNFGQRAYKYASVVPDGFKALCTQNLPDTFSGEAAGTKNNPSKYFDVKSHAGTGVDDTDNKGWNFGPDLIWSKLWGPSGGGYKWRSWDQVRGVTKELNMNDANSAESTQSGGIKQFNSDGFRVGTFNETGYTTGKDYLFVGWDAGTEAVENPSSSYNITPTGQWINTTAGFSITGYTGNGSDDQTLPHGLNAVPGLVIIKNRDSGTGSWIVKHSNLTSGKVLFLDTTAQEGDSSYGEIKDLDSNVTVTLDDTGNNAANVNKNNEKYIMYAWTAISGYSAFGHYIGTGTTTGAFVHTGFNPKFLIVKNCGSGGDWQAYDTTRERANPRGSFMEINDDAVAADDSYSDIDFLSNGFRIRDDGNDINLNNDLHVYIAFAEYPFKLSRGRY